MASCSSRQTRPSDHPVVGRTDRQRLEQGRAGAFLHQRQARLGMVCSCVDDVALQQLPAFHNIIYSVPLSRILSLVSNQFINLLLNDGAKKWFDVLSLLASTGTAIESGLGACIHTCKQPKSGRFGLHPDCEHCLLSHCVPPFTLIPRPCKQMLLRRRRDAKAAVRRR